MGRRKSTEVPPLHREEIYRIIGAARKPRDKAFISLLFLTGARISELIQLRRRDLRLEENDGRRYLVVRLPTLKRKSGVPVRDIPIPLEEPLLSNILTYVRTLEPNARLFPFSRRWGLELLKRLARESGVRDGDVWCHLLRASRISELKGYLSQIEISEFAGWTLPKSFGPIRHYVYLDWRSYAHKMPKGVREHV